VEQWEYWGLVQGVVKSYYITKVFSGEDHFTLVLSAGYDTTLKVRVVFYKTVMAYRMATETYNLTILDYLYKQYGKQFYNQWSTFKVIHSKYIAWLLQESCQIDQPFKHFSFWGIDSVVDVIAIDEPHIERIS
jgi:hypothetical protein